MGKKVELRAERKEEKDMKYEPQRHKGHKGGQDKGRGSFLLTGVGR